MSDTGTETAMYKLLAATSIGDHVDAKFASMTDPLPLADAEAEALPEELDPEAVELV